VRQLQRTTRRRHSIAVQRPRSALRWTEFSHYVAVIGAGLLPAALEVRGGGAVPQEPSGTGADRPAQLRTLRPADAPGRIGDELLDLAATALRQPGPAPRPSQSEQAKDKIPVLPPAGVAGESDSPAPIEPRATIAAQTGSRVPRFYLRRARGSVTIHRRRQSRGSTPHSFFPEVGSPSRGRGFLMSIRIKGGAQ
jgi:hypothetical protein